MKAIIPVAGSGTNLRPHTYTQPKVLIPMAGKTVLSVIMDELRQFDIEEYIFVIGYLGEKIQDYVLATYPDLNCSFVTQHERKGTGHAVLLTEGHVQEDAMLIVYGDTIATFDLQKVLDAPQSMIGVKRVDDPRAFGVAELDNDYNVLRVSEKPKIPKSNMALVGIYKILESTALFDALRAYIAGGVATDGEYHFTAGLQYMIDRGIPLKAFDVKGWYDCGRKDTLLQTNATLLKHMHQASSDSAQHFDNTVIIQPVHIGTGCTLENAIVGPFVSVGDGSHILNSVVSNSIIGAYARLRDVVLKRSIIGSDAYVHGLSQSLNIGDNTEIDLG